MSAAKRKGRPERAGLQLYAHITSSGEWTEWAFESLVEILRSWSVTMGIKRHSDSVKNLPRVVVHHCYRVRTTLI